MVEAGGVHEAARLTHSHRTQTHGVMIRLDTGGRRGSVSPVKCRKGHG